MNIARFLKSSDHNDTKQSMGTPARSSLASGYHSIHNVPS